MPNEAIFIDTQRHFAGRTLLATREMQSLLLCILRPVDALLTGIDDGKVVDRFGRKVRAAGAWLLGWIEARLRHLVQDRQKACDGAAGRTLADAKQAPHRTGR